VPHQESAWKKSEGYEHRSPAKLTSSKSHASSAYYPPFAMIAELAFM